MLKKLHLGIDIDEPLYPFVDCFRDYLKFSCDYKAAMPAPTQWDFAAQWDLSGAEFNQHFHDFERSDFHAQSRPVERAVVTLTALRELGYTITLVTSRGTLRGVEPGQRVAIQLSTSRWLYEQGIPYDGLAFTADKTSLLEAKI